MRALDMYHVRRKGAEQYTGLGQAALGEMWFDFIFIYISTIMNQI
jgi:hypothetical protein